MAAIYSSDLRRAWQTAEAIAAPQGLAVLPDTGLRERGFGHFEGLTFARIDAELPEQARLWRTRDPEFSPEGGESLLVFRERVARTVNAIAARHPGELVGIVAHGGVMDLLYRAATGQELQAPRTWLLGNAHINRMLWTEQGLTLVGWADDTHLNDGALDEAAAA